MKPLPFVLALVLVVAVLVPIPISAATPVVETFPLDETSAVFDPSPCDFEVWNHEVGTIRQVSYFDNQGNLLRIKLHISGTDTVYNLAHPDVTLSGDFAGVANVDLETGELVWVSGLPWHITAPGYGTVLVRAGRWMRYPDLQIAGRNSFVIATDIAQLCAALGGAPSSTVNATVAASEPYNFLFLPALMDQR